MSFLTKLLALIGHAFESLWKTTEDELEKLPPDQKEAAITGSIIPQIIKNNLDIGETSLTGLIIDKTHLPVDVIEPLLQATYKEFNTASLSEYQNLLKSSTGAKWMSLLEGAAKFIAGQLSGGKLTWESLGLGLIQAAYLKYVKGSN